MVKRFTPLKVSAPVRTCPVPSTEEIRRDQSVLRVGLNNGGDSPTLSFLTRELFQILDSGVASLSDMRLGRPWPRPRIEDIRGLVERYDEDTCRRAAIEAREIVQSQDRAPKVTALFAKKCADIAAERESVRDEIRKALA
jgi:hypothetical protein